MKILRLQFKNINNLKGEHEVSFDQLPLSTAGIFAIVGPTGSGKSTILDVITLALFNKIPRFKKSISKNEITSEGSVLTHHTREATASIEYEIKGLKYKSSWSVSTNRNGKLKDYEMTLYNPDGSIADLKRSEVPAQNENIIGLNYDQFIKSILLSQGEFSKFLKSDKNDRGKLLENITGTSIYRTIGIRAFEKHKEVKEELDREKAIIGEISTLSDDQRKELVNELEAAEKEKQKLEKVLAKSSQLEKVKSDILQIQQSLQSKQKAEKDVNIQVAAFKEKQGKLNLHHKLSPIQGSLANYNVAFVNAQSSQENLKQYQLQLEVSRKKHEETIKALSALTKTEVDESSFKKIMNDFETEINNADRDLQNFIQNGKEAREGINKNIIHYPIPISEKIKPNEAIGLLASREKAIQIVLNTSQLDKDKSQKELRAQLKQKQEELEALKEIQNYYQHIAELQIKLKGLKKELEELQKEEKIKSPLVLKYVELVEAGEQRIELLRKQKEDAIKIAELEEFRNQLVADAPCPLCGSLEHPYADHKPDLHKTEIDDNIRLAQSELKSKKQELESFRKELTQNVTSIELKQKLIIESKEKLTIVEKESERTIAKFNGKFNYDQNNITQHIEQLALQNKTTEDAIEAMEELIKNEELVRQYNQLQQNIEEYKKLKQSRDSKFTGSDINSVTNKLQDSFEASKTEITSFKVSIKDKKESFKRNTNLVTSISSELLPKIQKLGFSDINEISKHLLDENILTELTQQREDLFKRQTSIETEINTLKRDLVEKMESDTQPEILLESLLESIQEQKTLIETHNKTVITNQGILKRDDEDRHKIKSKEQAIAKLNQEVEKWTLLNKMIGDATGNKFANFAQGLTLQNLLVFANRRLQNLSDRYLLDKPENDGALIVIDKYQGNTRRSVRTLSGGESFLISLALALSLSDMASKNVALECLFIDEGFGTLDPESLESALNTLEKLQSESQKTVGVISHVEALKDRIDVQLKLNKNAQGYSQIEVFNQHQN